MTTGRPGVVPGVAVAVTEAVLASVARAVWDATLGLDLDGPVDPGARAAGDAAAGPRLSAVVALSGGFDGAVSLELSGPAGHEVATRMFGLGADELSWEDTADALGELANIVGGNVKALLGCPTVLSLPSVVEVPAGPDGPDHDHGGAVTGVHISSVTMRFGGDVAHGENVVRIALHATTPFVAGKGDR